MILLRVFALLLAGTPWHASTILAVPVVVPVTTETHEVYECVHSAHPGAANYTWYRQDSLSLPKGIKAEGNRLFFLQATSDLNGLYICIIVNEKGTFVASLYREKYQESILQMIFTKVLHQWMLLKEMFLLL